MPNLVSGLALSFAAAEKGNSKAAKRAREAAYTESDSKAAMTNMPKPRSLVNYDIGTPKPVNLIGSPNEKTEIVNAVVKNSVYDNLKIENAIGNSAKLAKNPTSVEISNNYKRDYAIPALVKFSEEQKEKLQKENEKKENSFWDTTSAALAAASLVPGVDSFTNIFEAIVDVARGDYVSAGLDALGIIPVWGEAADAAKVARKADDIADVVKISKNADNIADAVKVGDEAIDVARGVDGVNDAAKLVEKISPYKTKINMPNLLMILRRMA